MWADPQSSGCNPREKPIMTNNTCPRVRPFSIFRLTLALGVLMSAPLALMAQGPGTEDGLWTFLGGDAWHTRYTPSTQITAANFENLEVLWEWELRPEHQPCDTEPDRRQVDHGDRLPQARGRARSSVW